MLNIHLRPLFTKNLIIIKKIEQSQIPYKRSVLPFNEMVKHFRHFIMYKTNEEAETNEIAGELRYSIDHTITNYNLPPTVQFQVATQLSSVCSLLFSSLH